MFCLFLFPFHGVGWGSGGRGRWVGAIALTKSKDLPKYAQIQLTSNGMIFTSGKHVRATRVVQKVLS